MLTEEQPDVFGPVSIEKISVVGRQVKDTSAVSITTVTFENHRYATRLIFIQSTKLHALPVRHGNLQRRINMMRNSNLTQLNSNGTRRNRGSNNGGGSIQRPSPPPIQRNRKNIIKGSTIPHGIEGFPVGPFAEISIHLKFILITSPNQWSINSASSI